MRLAQLKIYTLFLSYCLCFVLLFKLIRAHIAKSRMKSYFVIEYFYIIKNTPPCFGNCFVFFIIYQLIEWLVISGWWLVLGWRGVLRAEGLAIVVG